MFNKLLLLVLMSHDWSIVVHASYIDAL